MTQQGFVVVPHFFARDCVRHIAGWIEELAAMPPVSGRHWVYHEAIEGGDLPRRAIQRIENFCPFHEGFERLIVGGALARWVAALCGGPVVLFKDKINFKMPGGAGFAAHQDQQAGWGRYAPHFVTAMVTVDATTLENGCLEIGRRPVSGGLLGEEWRPLEERELQLDPLPTAPGDVVFFDSFVPHASKANRSGDPRRVLYVTYNQADHGDQRMRYFADKHLAFPPDIDRDPAKTYHFRV